MFTKYGIIRSREEYHPAARKRKPVTLREKRSSSSASAGPARPSAPQHRSRRSRALGPPESSRRADPRATRANMESMLNVDLEAGRFFTPVEDDHAAAVAVIGYDVKDQIFPSVNPIGRRSISAAIPMRVIGLQSKQETSSARTRTTSIFAPISFVRKILTSRRGPVDLRAAARGHGRPRRDAGRGPHDPALAPEDPLFGRGSLRHRRLGGDSDALEVAHGGRLRA